MPRSAGTRPRGEGVRIRSGVGLYVRLLDHMVVFHLHVVCRSPYASGSRDLRARVRDPAGNALPTLALSPSSHTIYTFFRQR
jgi:hypothetical protein